MGAPPPDPELVERALAARRRGVRQEEVARICGVSVNTVRRWEAKYAPPREVRAVEVPEAAGFDEDPEGSEPQDILAVLREAAASMNAARRAAVRSRDARSATTIVNALAKLAPTLARLEHLAVQDTDMVRIPRAELEAAAAAYRERVSRLLEHPLYCARCGAIVRASLAGVDLEGEK